MPRGPFASITSRNIKLYDLPVPNNDQAGWPWTMHVDPLPLLQPNGKPWPKITVVTPSYNQDKFLEEAIRSVLLQGYPNLEYIVIDGGSNDESCEVIKKYEDWITYWVSEPDTGQSNAINKGFSHATGEIYAWLNSDDRYLPTAFNHVAQYFVRNPNVDVVVGEARKVTAEGNLIYKGITPELTLSSFLYWRDKGRPEGKGGFLQPACFFRRRAWDKSGPLREELHYCMDVDLWMKMVQDFHFAPLRQELAYAVGHPQAKTTGQVERTVAEINLLIAQHGGWEIACRGLFEQADELARCREKIQRVSNYPVVKQVYPLIRVLHKWLAKPKVHRIKP